MPRELIRVGVLAVSRPPVTRWAGRVLKPLSVGPELPGIATRVRVSEQEGIETWYLGAHGLHLHSGDTGHYRDNLAAVQPSVWVALRESGKAEHAEVVLVTTDPYEGEALASDPSLMVEAVPMTAEVKARLVEFIAAYHVEIPFKKRRRRPVDIEADPRGARILTEAEKWGRR